MPVAVMTRRTWRDLGLAALANSWLGITNRRHRSISASVSSSYGSSCFSAETFLLVLLPVLASCAALVVSARTTPRTTSTTAVSVTPSSLSSLMTSLPPTRQLPPDTIQIYMSRGTTGRLGCPAEANPPATLIVWSKDGRVVDPGSDSAGDGGRREIPARVTTSDMGNLIIDNVSMSDAGLYKCTAYSPLSSKHPTHHIFVIVKELPYFIVRPALIYHASHGGSVTFTCVADGEPKPKIVWRKVAGEFPPSTRTLQDVGNLTIVMLSREDQGVYECIATNVVTSIITATLLIIRFHNTPYNLTVHTTSSMAKVSWLPAHREGYRYHYLLWFRRSRDRDWQSLRVVPNDSVLMYVHELEPGTSYEFVVMARDLHGIAHFSNAVQANTTSKYVDCSEGGDDEDDCADRFEASGESPTTKEGRHVTNPGGGMVDPVVHRKLPLPPVNVTATLSPDADAVLISWFPPPADPSAPPVQRYVIEYRTVGPSWLRVADKHPGTSYRLKPASRGTVYHIRVMSDAGTKEPILSKPSQETTLHTGDPSSGASTGERSGLSSGAVTGIVMTLLLIIGGAIAGVMAVRWYLAEKKRRQRQLERFEQGRSSSLSIHRTLSGQESPLRSQSIVVHDNHVTPTTNHDHFRHVQETPI